MRPCGSGTEEVAARHPWVPHGECFVLVAPSQPAGTQLCPGRAAQVSDSPFMWHTERQGIVHCVLITSFNGYTWPLPSLLIYKADL